MWQNIELVGEFLQFCQVIMNVRIKCTSADIFESVSDLINYNRSAKGEIFEFRKSLR